MDRRLIVVAGFVAVVLIVVLFVITIPQHTPPPDMAIPAEAQKADYAVTKDLVINVYVDGSGSIKQFLNAAGKPSRESAGGARNYLAYLLENIGSVSENPLWEPLWGKDRGRFWIFGEDCPERSDAQKIINMGINPAGFPIKKDTKLEVPYNQDWNGRTGNCNGNTRAKQGAESVSDEGEPGPPELKILISDLYVSETKQKNLADILGPVMVRKYLSGDKTAICILAVRNPYYGKVDDFPGSAAEKPEATSMPFYVIFTGPIADVQYGTRLFLDHLGLKDAFTAGKAQLIYFSQKAGYVETAPDIPDGKRNWREFDKNYNGSGIPVYALDKGTMPVTWTEPPEGKWAVPDGSWDWESSYSIATGTISGSEVSAEIYGSDKKTRNPSRPDAQAKRAAGACPGGSDAKDSGNHCIAIDRSVLTHGRDYLFRVDVKKSPSQNFADDADAMRPWSFNPLDLNDPEKRRHILAGDGSFSSVHGIRDSSPGRTPHFSRLLRLLQEAIYPNDAPSVANHHFIFVQAN